MPCQLIFHLVKDVERVMATDVVIDVVAVEMIELEEELGVGQGPK